MTDPNDSAFPLHVEGYKPDPGLTKREYFAAMAMQGMLSDSSMEGTLELYAENAVMAADALIKQLNKE